MKKKTILNCLLLGLALSFSMPSFAVSDSDHLVDMKIDDASRTIIVTMDNAFGNQTFTEKLLKKI